MRRITVNPFYLYLIRCAFGLVVYSQSSYGAVIMDSNNLEVFYVAFIFAALLSACYSAFNLFLMVRVGENLLKTLRMQEHD